jgi:hypothetical protein
MSPRPLWQFIAINVVVWVVMTVILVVVPDTLERWVPLTVSRVLGWAVACGVWVVSVESQWQRRLSAVPRFFVQVILWVGAALVAMWISDQFRVDYR